MNALRECYAPPACWTRHEPATDTSRCRISTRPIRANRIATAPLCEAIEALPATLAEVADWLGWDLQRLKRRLGLIGYYSAGTFRLAVSIDRTSATAICRAACVDPVDVGL
jgi:hypothetical protein